MDRCARFNERLKEAGLDLALIYRPENIQYLTGYTGEGNALIGEDKKVILTDFRYIEQAGRQAPDWQVVRVGGDVRLDEALSMLIGKDQSVGIEEDYVTVAQRRMLEKALPGRTIGCITGMTEQLRRVKEPGEIEKLRRACQISCQALENMLPRIHAGMTEKQVQVALDYEMLNLGADSVGFNTIAAAGVNGSLPHAIPSDKVLMEGELLTLDFGALYQGYHADMTRTLAIGEISSELSKMYEDVRVAQQMALDAVRSGVPNKEVDAVARKFLDGIYPGAFGHGLGHSVGLLIHEAPNFNTRDLSVLEPGIVITVEPGVYLPGVGGVRIEDTVAVTEDGYDNLVTFPKELIHVK